MANTVDKLKELLFAPESEAIDALTHRIDAVFDRAGTTERFQSSIASVLDGALREAEVARHEDMASAIAPLILRTVKTEIVNSRDELVEVLYPQLGKMLRAFVSAEIKRVIDDANRRFERNPVMLRLNALLTGRSASELALSDIQRLQVETVFLIRRATGELVARWPQCETGSNLDHVMGGVLTAINEFTLEAFKAEGSALRQIDLSGSQVYLRVSPTFLLAAKCAGSSPAGVETAFDDEFLNLLERRQGTLDAVGLGGRSGADGSALMADLAHRLEARLSALQPQPAALHGGVRPLTLLATLIGLPLAAWLAWGLYVDYRIAHVERVARDVVAADADMRGYPTGYRVGQRGRALAISGLAPSGAVKDRVIAQVSALLPDVAIQNELSAVPVGGIDTEPLLAMMSARQAAFETDVTAKATARSDARARRLLSDMVLVLKPFLAEQGSPQTLAGLAAEADVLDTSLAVPVTGAEREKLAQRTLSLADKMAALAPVRVAVKSRSVTSDEMDLILVGAESALASADAYAAERMIEARIKAISLPVIPPPSPREQLEQFARSHAVFFGDGTSLRDEAQARQTLDELAALIVRSPGIVRLIGYTDEAGLPAKNAGLAKSRADVVAAELIARGVPQQSLVQLSRTSPETTISPVTGSSSSNRRVEFEVGFIGESAR
jgi:outer membrane protein OmpA-like peptidoglycan-associated protein